MILVSHCNLPESGYGLCSYEDGELQPVEKAGQGASFTGLAIDDGYVWVVRWNDLVGFSRKDSSAFGSDSVFESSSCTPLPSQGTHSIWVRGDDFYVVSTGTDQVLHTDGGPWRVAFAAGNGTRDTHHINGLTEHDGRLVVSMFGTTDGPWKHAKNGQLVDVETSEVLLGGILQPHSPLSWKGDLWFCESAAERIRSLSGAEYHVGGFVRGLAPLSDRYLVYGTGPDRHGDTLGQVASLRWLDIETGDTEHLAYARGPEVYAVVTEGGGS